jgi:putative oxidoreductase
MTGDRHSAFFLFFARYALAIAFLSAVADRLGLWGPMGTPGVDWGNMENFNGAVAGLSPWAPPALVPALAWFVTILEAVLGVLLIIGYRLRATAFVSGVLLIIFALSMALFLGVKLPLNYSVFTAAACAFLVYAFAPAAARDETFEEEAANADGYGRRKGGVVAGGFGRSVAD